MLPALPHMGEALGVGDENDRQFVVSLETGHADPVRRWKLSPIDREARQHHHAEHPRKGH